MEARFSPEALEEYFDDLRALFLRRFSVLTLGSTLEEHEERRMIELLRELFYIHQKLEMKDEEI